MIVHAAHVAVIIIHVTWRNRAVGSPRHVPPCRVFIGLKKPFLSFCVFKTYQFVRTDVKILSLVAV